MFVVLVTHGAACMRLQVIEHITVWEVSNPLLQGSLAASVPCIIESSVDELWAEELGSTEESVASSQ